MQLKTEQWCSKMLLENLDLENRKIWGWG